MEYQKFHHTRKMPQDTTAVVEMHSFYNKGFTAVLDILLAQIHLKTGHIKVAFKPLLDALCPTQIPVVNQVNAHCRHYPADLPHQGCYLLRLNNLFPTLRSMLHIMFQMIQSVSPMEQKLHFTKVILDYSRY